MQPWLELIELSKHYGAQTVLDDVTFAVDEGEIFTLLGPSGTGKSTLLKAIAGLVRLDAGRICLAGREITHVPTRDRNVGVVFQDYSLFPSMSVRENVAFPLVARRTGGLVSLVWWHLNEKERSAAYRRADEVLDLVHLSSHASKRPNQLSGGEQQRAALARALAFNPDLLCLDEPFSALDKNLRQELQQQICDLQRRLGKTVLYVTHDQSEAMLVSTRIGIMNRGRIEQIGSAEELYSKPVNAFVARFLGDCNLLQLNRIERVGSHFYIFTSGGTRLTLSSNPPVGCDMIAIRPEKLVMQHERSGDGQQLVGTVETIAFLGAELRLEVRLDSGERVRIVTLAGDRTHPVRPNDRVYLRYNSSDVCVIPHGPPLDPGRTERVKSAVEESEECKKN